MNNPLFPQLVEELIIFQALMEVEQERMKEDSKKLDVTMHHLHEKIRNAIVHLCTLFHTMPCIMWVSGLKRRVTLMRRSLMYRRRLL